MPLSTFHTCKERNVNSVQLVKHETSVEMADKSSGKAGKPQSADVKTRTSRVGALQTGESIKEKQVFNMNFNLSITDITNLP